MFKHPKWFAPLIAGIFLVVACAFNSGWDGPDRRGNPTLKIINDSHGIVRVYLDDWFMGSVSGSEGCIVLRSVDIQGHGRVSLQVTAERPFRLPAEVLGTQGWLVRVGPWSTSRELDAISLRPAPHCT